jgi:HPt (histidine-containing phosphotransfer) domain-containing protein
VDGPFSRQPEFVARGHQGEAIAGHPDVPTVLLALGEVAELLGEPEGTILAACRSFPEHVPVVGAGRGRRFPSIALDVLRLVTDATAAGVPAQAIVHLLDTHHANARELAHEIQATPGGIPAGYEYVASPFDVDELAGRIQDALQSDVMPAIHAVTADLANTQAAIDQMRAELRDVVRADDIDRLRVETQSLLAGQISLSRDVDLTGELTKIHAELRPALHRLDEVMLAVDGLREEMAAMRWQLDQREQLGRLVLELTELRVQVSRLESIPRRSDDPDPSLSEPVANGNDAAGATEDPPLSVTEDGGLDGDTAPGFAEPAAGVAPPEPDAPSAIITEFASRTPRRMGRTLFADEG